MYWQGRRFWVEQCKEDGRETGDEELGYGDENAVNALFKEDISIRLEVHRISMERKQMHTHQDNPSLPTQRSWIIPFPIPSHTRTAAPINNLIFILVITALAWSAEICMARLRPGITQHAPPLLSSWFLVFASV